MHICLNGITIVLDETNIDTLVNVLAEKLLPRLEENWSKYLQTQLVGMATSVATISQKQEELLETVGKLESDYQDLETRLDESDNKFDDYVSTSDIDVDEVNNVISQMADIDIDDVNARIDEVESKVDQINDKAIIQKIARMLLEASSVMV